MMSNSLVELECVVSERVRKMGASDRTTVGVYDSEELQHLARSVAVSYASLRRRIGELTDAVYGGVPVGSRA